MKKSIKSSLLHALAAAVLVVIPMHQAQSAPGTLATSPLFLSTVVEPNVFLTFDDSRSMVTETLVPQDTTQVRGLNFTVNEESLPYIQIGGDVLLVYLHPDFYNFNVVPPVAALAEAWVFKNSQANKLYYDPAVNYIPWAGSDAAGNPLYPEYPADAAPMSPNNPGVTTDLTATYLYLEMGLPGTEVYLPTYYVWDQAADINGVIDADTDAYTEFIITGAELQNFSNWWVYYRTRESSIKSAMGRIINNTDSNRMGLRLFNAGHIIDAATMTDSNNKLALLTALYNTNAVAPGNLLSPARTALEETGLMFAGASTVPTPILPAADGGTCQQNFNILMTDGYWNGPAPTWGTPSPFSNNTDKDTGCADCIFDGDASQSNDGGNYADIYSDTLADVAMRYYEDDLAPSMLDEVPERTGVDLATHQHLVNYTLSFGLTGSPGMDSTKVDPATEPGFAWTDPTASPANKIDDLWHAAYNSRGEHLFVSGSSTELQNQLSLSIFDITERTGTSAAVAVNSAQLSTNSAIYVAQFNTDGWQGNLISFGIDTDTGALLAENWSASEILTNRDLDANPRTIITHDAATASGVAFRWTDISIDMQNDLLTNPLGSLDADTSSSGPGAARLDYIRGDRSNETFGYGFRERLSLLGDLVNSGPVFVGPPNLSWPDIYPFPTGGSAYSKFKESHENRIKMVYAGANDGMLHGFEDANGREKLAYIPGAIYQSLVPNAGLHYLSDPNYIHQYYVDLTPSVSDIFYNSNWHTVLMGGLRGGGRGYYALDVTNPGSFKEADAAAISLWEFTSDDDADLGYTFSRPTIGLSNADTWVAIFGNGYNQIGTGSGEAALFIVDIEKGIDGFWDPVGDYVKISTGVGTPGAQNGLATPALADLDGNGTIDRAYAGDLEGNMWVFDLSGQSPNSWKVATKSGSTAIPLFTTPADPITGNPQPITAKPVLASHPNQPDTNSNKPNIMVYFGTGQYLVSGDKVTTDVQSFYGVWDTGDSALTQATLVEQTFDPSFAQRVLTRNPVDYSIKHGWFFNLPDSGERSVTSPIARGDTVFFNSFVPVEDACSQGGYGYRFAVDMATGGSPLVPTIDSNADGVVDDNDYANNGSIDGVIAAIRQEGFLPEPVFIENLTFTGEKGSKIKSLATVPSGRFSWIELLY